MGFFNDLGKILGGVASAVVPGFSTLAKTGIFGNDLAALNGAPGAPPVAAVVKSSPVLQAQLLTAPLQPPAPGQVTCIPTRHLVSLVGENRRLTGRGGVFVPPVAQVAMTRTTPISPLAALGSGLGTLFGSRTPAATGAFIPPPAVGSGQVPTFPSIIRVMGAGTTPTLFVWRDAFTGSIHEELSMPSGGRLVG